MGISPKKAGLSLAEIILCLAIIIGAVVLVAGVFPFSYQADQKAWKKSSAQRIASSTIERMRGEEFDSLASGFALVQVENVPYEVTVVVTDSSPEPVKAKNVVCEVVWRTRTGTEKFVQETRIARFYRPE